MLILSKYHSNIKTVLPFHGNQTITSQEGKGSFILYHGNFDVSENLKSAKYLIEYVFNGLKIPVKIAGKNALKKLNQFNNLKNLELIENHRVFPNKLNELLLESDYSLYWVLSYLFNPQNHRKSNINYFPNICQENILAIPKEKSKNYNTVSLDKIIDEKTPPQKVHTRMI